MNNPHAYAPLLRKYDNMKTKLPAAVTSPDQYSNHCHHKKIRLSFFTFILKTEYFRLF